MNSPCLANAITIFPIFWPVASKSKAWSTSPSLPGTGGDTFSGRNGLDPPRPSVTTATFPHFDHAPRFCGPRSEAAILHLPFQMYAFGDGCKVSNLSFQKSSYMCIRCKNPVCRVWGRWIDTAIVLGALRERGRRREDLRHIVLTHGHIDHIGGCDRPASRELSTNRRFHVFRQPAASSVWPIFLAS